MVRMLICWVWSLIIFFFVSQHWTHIINGATIPPVIKRYLGGLGVGSCDFMEPPLAAGFGGSTLEAKNICKISF